jgi:hypothetical protein
MATDKKIISVLNNLNSGIAEIGNHILLMFKLSIICLILTLLGTLFVAGRGWVPTLGIILLVVDILIIIFSIYSVYQLATKLKSIENSNDISILELLKSHQ